MRNTIVQTHLCKYTDLFYLIRVAAQGGFERESTPQYPPTSAPQISRLIYVPLPFGFMTVKIQL